MNVLKRAVILGTGSYLPERVRTNKEVETTSGTRAEWISENLGIFERRIAADGELTSDMAAIAATRAMDSAGVKPLDIQLVIVATATPDRLAPSTACIVQDRIGAYNAAAFDMNAVCSGFMFALAAGSNFITGMGLSKVLVIGADCFSRFTDWSRRDAAFFGDGAGAAVIGLSNDATGFRSFKLCSDGRGKDNFTIAGGGAEFSAELLRDRPELRHFQMKAQEVYKTATRVLPEVIEEVLKANGITIAEIQHLLLHQASMKVIRKVAESIGAPLEKVRTNMQNYANTSSATVPILLDETLRSGKINRGDYALFGAVGSGWTWAAALYQF